MFIYFIIMLLNVLILLLCIIFFFNTSKCVSEGRVVLNLFVIDGGSGGKFEKT